MNTEPTICGVCGRDIGEERVNGICKECFEKVTSGENKQMTTQDEIRQTIIRGLKEYGPMSLKQLAAEVFVHHAVSQCLAIGIAKDILETLMHKDKCVEVYNIVYNIDEPPAPAYVYIKKEGGIN